MYREFEIKKNRLDFLLTLDTLLLNLVRAF